MNSDRCVACSCDFLTDVKVSPSKLSKYSITEREICFYGIKVCSK